VHDLPSNRVRLGFARRNVMEESRRVRLGSRTHWVGCQCGLLTLKFWRSPLARRPRRYLSRMERYPAIRLVSRAEYIQSWFSAGWLSGKCSQDCYHVLSNEVLSGVAIDESSVRFQQVQSTPCMTQLQPPQLHSRARPPIVVGESRTTLSIAAEQHGALQAFLCGY
jgi:hypothetical protein